jgi:hypothetical protein
MNKLLISFIFSLFTAMCSISSVAIASECANDPNECTLSKLCEMATSSDSDGNTIWAISSDKLKHTTAAQSLGIECGVKPIVDPCDLDPNECKLNQICDKATTEISGKKGWDESAEAYVSFAKKFGLKCDVETFYSEDAKLKDDQQNKKYYLCNKATITKNGQTSWNMEFFNHVLEAQKNNLTCGVNAISSPNLKINTKDKFCSKATIIKNGVISWNTEFPSYVIAAKELGKTCNVNVISSVKMKQNKKDKLCMKATIIKNGVTSWNMEMPILVIAAKNKGKTCGVRFDSSKLKNGNIKKAFLLKSKADRKKLQEALKKLGLYHHKIDGLWGSGTDIGLNHFIEEREKLHDKSGDYVFKYLLYLYNSGVTALSIKRQKAIKDIKKAVEPNKNNAGLTAIISNPSISGRQALAICKPEAKLAKSRNSANANTSRKSRNRTYDLDCSYGTCTAREMTPSGGKWGGILEGLTQHLAGKNAYNAVMDSCLAEYGWRD